MIIFVIFLLVNVETTFLCILDSCCHFIISVSQTAIHHLAMVRIICVQTVGLSDDELPEGFGRAPSTILFEKKQEE